MRRRFKDSWITFLIRFGKTKTGDAKSAISHLFTTNYVWMHIYRTSIYYYYCELTVSLIRRGVVGPLCLCRHSSRNRVISSAALCFPCTSLSVCRDCWVEEIVGVVGREWRNHVSEVGWRIVGLGWAKHARQYVASATICVCDRPKVEACPSL